MNRAILCSFVGHLVVFAVLFVATAGRGERSGTKVYNVSIVPGIGFPGGGSGGPGSGGKAAVGVAGMVGKPGTIGGAALPAAKPLKGTALVEATSKSRKPRKLADSTRTGGSEPIAMRVYGRGGTIGGGGPAGEGPGGGSGRPATAFEIAMNNKILPNWNEDLWKTNSGRLTCTISFLIAGDGTVSGVRVFEPSGNSEFDLAARRAIEIATLPAPTTFGIEGNVHEARVTFVNRPD
jgi:TonB family protein